MVLGLVGLAAAALLGSSPVAAIDNGLGGLPPMGWRSWNAYGGAVNQSKMIATVDKMVERTRLVDGKPASLLDLGYANVGLDDNWQRASFPPILLSSFLPPTLASTHLRLPNITLASGCLGILGC